MRWAVVAVLVALAQPAWALSCMPPDVTTDFARAAESPDTYIVVRGDLIFEQSALPRGGAQAQGRNDAKTDIPAWLKGMSLTRDGFTRRFERDVMLRVSCIGPWCGGTSNGDHLVFLKQEGQNWILALSPCPGVAYPNPTRALEEQVLSCFRGEGCGAN